MKRFWINLLAIAGCISVFSGVVLLATGTYTVRAQDEALPPAEYVGAKECSSCHRNLARAHGDTNHALALQEIGRKKDAILGDFEQGEELRTVTLPGEDAPRPFTADDVAYAVGTGQHMQSYLYEVDRNDYMVLPAAWNVEKQAWEAVNLGNSWPSGGYDWENNCAFCHTTGFNVERGRWDDAGVQCEACHGPGSNHVDAADDAGRRPDADELTAIRSAIYTQPDSQVCGQCHSVGAGADDHPYPVGYTPGADLTQFFQLVSSDDATHWWASGHADHMNMQYNEWIKGAHQSSLTDMLKSDFADDKCLSCHSEDARLTDARIAAVESGDRLGDVPQPATIETAHAGITCSSCHYQHTDSEQPAELIDEANSLCMGCHTNPTGEDFIHHPVKEMFEGVALVDGVEGISGAHFAAEDGPRCVTCHMQELPVGTTSRVSHLFQPVLPGQADGQLPSACAGCHDDLNTTDLQLLVDNTRTVVNTRLTDAKTALEAIAEPPEGSDEAVLYAQAGAALRFVENDGSLGIHNYDYADALLDQAEHDIAVLTGTETTPEPVVTPEATSAPSDVPSQVVAEERISSGIRPVTVIFIGAVLAVIGVAAFFFFRRPGD